MWRRCRLSSQAPMNDAHLTHLSHAWAMLSHRVGCFLWLCYRIVASTAGLTHRRWLSAHAAVRLSRCCELGRCLCDTTMLLLSVAPTAFSPDVSGEQPTYTYVHENQCLCTQIRFVGHTGHVLDFINPVSGSQHASYGWSYRIHVCQSDRVICVTRRFKKQFLTWLTQHVLLRGPHIDQ